MLERRQYIWARKENEKVEQTWREEIEKKQDYNNNTAKAKKKKKK